MPTPPSPEFVDRVALVTGGASGIGLAIATELNRLGARVVIADISKEAAEQAAGTLDGAVGLAVDVSDRSAVEAVFDLAESTTGPIDMLVNNAGISRDRGIRGISDDDWNRTIAVNQTGVFLCSQAAARRMVPRGEGRILNIASRAWLGWWGQTSYAASKGAVVSMTRSLAIELSKYGIAVNCLAPGLINTPLLRAEPPEVMEKLMAAQPTGTIGSGADIAYAASFLLDPTVRGVTGEVLYVCGGKSLYARPAVTA